MYVSVSLTVSAICFPILWHYLFLAFLLLATDVTVGIPVGVLVVCSLALLLLVVLASWKLCWIPCRNKVLTSSSSVALTSDSYPSFQPLSLEPSPQQPQAGMAMEKVKESLTPMGFLEAAVKISHTSPDIPAEVQLSMKEHFLQRTQRLQRQTTEPASSAR